MVRQSIGLFFSESGILFQGEFLHFVRVPREDWLTVGPWILYLCRLTWHDGALISNGKTLTSGYLSSARQGGRSPFCLVMVYSSDDHMTMRDPTPEFEPDTYLV